jgi:HD-GYP domain-containing protein (c-di-GMP phosphodiesterase class II)
MAKVLIFEPDEHLMELLSANLQSELAAEVICCQSQRQVKSILEREEKIDCVLLRAHLGSEALAISVLNFMFNKGLLFKTLVIGEVNFQETFARCLPNEIKIKELLDEIMKELGVDQEKASSNSLPDYVGFNLHYFFQINTFVSDIYIKIKKKDNHQYLKRILANDEFDKKLLLKYKQSGLEKLYIEKEYRHHFWDALITENISRLKDIFKNSSSFPAEHIIELSNDSYNLSQDLMASLGVTEQTVKLTSSSIKTMTDLVKSMDKMGPMLKKLLSNEGSYAYKKCHLISMFSVDVLKKLDWFPNDKFQESINIMVFVAFMHDIVLPTEELLRIHNKIALYRSDISDQEKELVKNHANIVSTFIQKYPRAPAGADVIIKQHHGATNGIGFTEGNNSNLSKYAIVLIVLESFVIRLLDFKAKEDSIKSIIEEFYEEFTQPSYKKVMDSLVATILSAAKNK